MTKCINCQKQHVVNSSNPLPVNAVETATCKFLEAVAKILNVETQPVAPPSPTFICVPCLIAFGKQTDLVELFNMSPNKVSLRKRVTVYYYRKFYPLVNQHKTSGNAC